MVARLIAAYARWVVRHRTLVLLAVSVTTVFLVRQAAGLHVEVNPDHLLPQQHPYIQTLNEVHRVFGDKNLVVIGLFPKDGRVFTPAFLAKVDEVTRRMEALPGANPALVHSIAASNARSIVGTGDDVDVRPLMESVPADQAGADEVRSLVFGNEAFVGTLVSADGSAASVQVSFELTHEIPDYLKLYERVRREVEASNDGSFEIALAGPVVYAAHLAERTARMAVFFPLALLVIGLVHYEAFRTVQALVLPLITALLSVAWALGFMGLLGVQFDPYNVSTPILILAVAAGHAVQVLKRFYEEYARNPDRDAAIVAALGHVGPVMLAAGLVAALSFCSLATFGLATIRTFGLLTGFGILSALVIEFTVIPAVRALLPAPRSYERDREAAGHPWIDRVLLACNALTLRRGRGLAAVAGAILLACVAAGSLVVVDNSYKRAFGDGEAARIEDDRLNGSFAGTNTLVLVVEGEGEGALEDPAVVDAIWRLERKLEARQAVGRAFSYVDVLAEMHEEMNRDRQGAGALPATRALAAQYLFLYSLSGGDQGLEAMLDPSRRLAKVRVLTHEDSTRFGDALIDAVRRFVASEFPVGYRVRYAGSLASTSAATEVMVDGKLRNIVQIAAIIVAIAALLLRSVVGALIVATPLVFTVAVNFGVMGVLGLPLDTNTATIAAIAVGIGADYAIYLVFRIREEGVRARDIETAVQRAILTSGKAVLFVSSAIAAGYGVLCFCGFSHYLRLGGLVALAMIVSSTSALVIVPALIVRLRPRFIARCLSADACVGSSELAGRAAA